jgi:dephospho-CoA kinase
VPPLVVGLSGGVGSGKSTVARMLAREGARVIDADALGHRVLEIPGMRRALAREFGAEILKADGSVDRPRLGREAFRDRRSVERLNRTVHPEILKRIRTELRKARGWTVLDAALLHETGIVSLCDRVIFVEAPLGLRRERAKERGWSGRELSRRERLQGPLRDKRKYADFVVDASGSLARTAAQVRRIVRELATCG